MQKENEGKIDLKFAIPVFFNEPVPDDQGGRTQISFDDLKFSMSNVKRNRLSPREYRKS